MCEPVRWEFLPGQDHLPEGQRIYAPPTGGLSEAAREAVQKAEKAAATASEAAERDLARLRQKIAKAEVRLADLGSQLNAERRAWYEREGEFRAIISALAAEVGTVGESLFSRIGRAFRRRRSR